MVCYLNDIKRMYENLWLLPFQSIPYCRQQLDETCKIGANPRKFGWSQRHDVIRQRYLWRIIAVLLFCHMMETFHRDSGKLRSMGLYFSCTWLQWFKRKPLSIGPQTSREITLQGRIHWASQGHHAARPYRIYQYISVYQRFDWFIFLVSTNNQDNFLKQNQFILQNSWGIISFKMKTLGLQKKYIVVSFCFLRHRITG